jgi:hypothetical protein
MIDRQFINKPEEVAWYVQDEGPFGGARIQPVICGTSVLHTISLTMSVQIISTVDS